MNAVDWIIAGFVLITLVYVSFVLTLRDWLRALSKGEAVTLLPERGGRKWPIWTQVVLMVIGLAICVPFFHYLWIPLLAISSPLTGVFKLLGIGLYGAGLALVLWARHTLGRNWGISTSTQVKLRDEHQLVDSGPYARLRHPMYSGWWLSMLGLDLIYPVWAVFLMLVFSVISFASRARREEKVLAERFGEAWTDYRKRTWRLIPWIY